MLNNERDSKTIPPVCGETGRLSIIGGEGYPFVFREYNQIAKTINETEMSVKGSEPKYDGANTWTNFGDFITFIAKPVPHQNMLQENREVVRFP